MMTYDETTISNPMSEFTIPFFALSGLFPELAAKMYISPETMSAIVTNVPINMVADNTMSCTKSPTDVGSLSFPTLFLIPRVS